MLIFHPISSTLRATTVAFLFLASLFLPLFPSFIPASPKFAFYLCYYAELWLFIVCGAAIKKLFSLSQINKRIKKEKNNTDPKWTFLWKPQRQRDENQIKSNSKLYSHMSHRDRWQWERREDRRYESLLNLKPVNTCRFVRNYERGAERMHT